MYLKKTSQVMVNEQTLTNVPDSYDGLEVLKASYMY